MQLIAITGGIGSGKSVVSRIVKVIGYEVYDCDSRARALMTTDEEVRHLLVEAFGPETYLADGSLNRQHLSRVAFGNDAALAILNNIVHPATARDMKRWAVEQELRNAPVAFCETALLRTAGLDRVVDAVWHVTAPEQVRVGRVMTRSGLTVSQVKERMLAQALEEPVADGEHALVNDNDIALLPQVIRLLKEHLEVTTFS